MQMQIKAEKQDPAYSLAVGYQSQAPPVLTAQNGAPLQAPSHPSQLPTPTGQLPPTLQPMHYQAGYTQGAGQPPYYPPPQQQNENSTEKPAEPEKPKISENQIDFSSVKGIFGWTTVDGINVPYIFRKDKKFVSVRVVEQKLLSRYPNSYPDELGKHQPLTSYFITAYEAKLLNEINLVHCGGEFGQKQFNTKDLIVLLEDFVDFYNLVKKTFPESKQSVQTPPLQSMLMNTQHKEDTDDPCGWIQVNNTVTPYVKRSKQGKFVPLSVMKYAAALSIPEKGVLPSDEECDLLNKACKLAGFNFTFSKTTRIICLTDIVRYCSVHLIELPMENPLQHAQYLDLSPSPASQSSTTPTNTQPPQPTSAGIQPAPTPPSPKSRPQSTEKPAEKPPANIELTSPSRFPPPAPGMTPRYFDPRYMTNTFSYNRHPYMYPIQYGPPNVTVNQPHPAFPQMQMGRPPYLQNGQYPAGQIPGVRNPGKESLKNRLSPARGPVNANNNSAPKTSMNNRITPPHSAASARPHVPPSQVNMNHIYQQRFQGHMMPPGVMQGYNRPMTSSAPNTMTTPRSNGPRQSSPSSGGQSGTMTQSFPFMPKYPMPHGQNVPNFPHGRPPSGTGSSKQSAIPPPPHMSGPHQAGQMPQSQRPQQQQNLSNGFSSLSQNHQNPPRQPNSHPNSVVQGQGSLPNSSGQSKPPPVVPATGLQLGGSKSTNQNLTPPKSQESGKSAPPALVDSIKGVWLSGKSISCMHLDRPGRKGKFCLVEAVCKLYFNGCSVNEFLYALENVLKVPLVTCTDEEEKSFIHYYSLPVTVLKCNKMIDYDDLNKYFPQLSYVFKDKTGSNSDSQKSSSKNHSENSSGNNNMAKDGHGQPNGVRDGNHLDLSRKRPNAGGGVPPNKQPCRRLEETVQRLMNQQGSALNDNQNRERSQTNETGGAIIILD